MPFDPGETFELVLEMQVLAGAFVQDGARGVGDELEAGDPFITQRVDREPPDLQAIEFERDGRCGVMDVDLDDLADVPMPLRPRAVHADELSRGWSDAR